MGDKVQPILEAMSYHLNDFEVHHIFNKVYKK